MLSTLTSKLGLCKRCMGLSLAGTVVGWMLFVGWITILPSGNLFVPTAIASLVVAAAFSALFVAHVSAFTIRFARGLAQPCANCPETAERTIRATPAHDVARPLPRRDAARIMARVGLAGVALSALGLKDLIVPAHAQQHGHTCGFCREQASGLLWVCDQRQCPEGLRCVAIISEEHAAQFCQRFKNPHLVCRICLP